MMQILANREFLTALVLFCISAVFTADADANIKDWIFPNLANYLILGIAVALLAQVVFTAIMKRLPEIERVTPESRIAAVDVTVFFLIVLAYMFVMYGLGFWISSLLMLTLTSVYLTLDKTRHNIKLALVVPLCCCIVFYFVFLHLFYVPFPEPSWWPGFS